MLFRSAREVNSLPLLADAEGRQIVVRVGRYGPYLERVIGEAPDGTVQTERANLPEDLAPLREAVHRIAVGQADVAMFTTSIQIPHLFRIAAEEGLQDAMVQALRRMAIASIGPTTSETLEDFGLQPDITPTHPKMGFLVKETAEQAGAILERKRAARA